LKDFVRGNDAVLATKVNGRKRARRNGAGLSRKAIFAEIDLRRGATEFGHGNVD
jgi:1-deoxyxylulose-5-phosphate synthase